MTNTFLEEELKAEEDFRKAEEEGMQINNEIAAVESLIKMLIQHYGIKEINIEEESKIEFVY